VRGWIGACLAAAVAVTVLGAGCASFPDAAASFGAQPSLTPKIATLVTPTPPSASPRTTPESTTSDSPGDPASSVPTSSQSTADPCAPSMPPVIATCLDAPWGLAVLPGGQSALVGERTTGKILKVTAGKEPELVARVTGLDTAGGGGLLGLALSPYYTEDSLIYAYVTTRTDNRIVRIAPGQKPKAIFTGIPAGDVHNGGPIAFGADDLLYVATGDAGDPAAPAEPGSLAGKVLRLDAYGKPAGAGSADGTESGGSGAPSTADTPGTTTRPAVYASGFTDPTGICPLPGQRIGTVDHRATGDLLIPVASGRDYTHPASGDTLWVYQAGDGGAVDCAVSNGYLMASSLDAKKVTSIQMTPTGGFTGSPNDVARNEFGRLRTIVTGQDDLVWLTTSNKDGHGKPIPSDDRVVVLPAGGGGGSGGVD
jgi:glucose/arabinose dehydrogenase